MSSLENALKDQHEQKCQRPGKLPKLDLRRLRVTYIGTGDEDGLVDLVTEDFRLNEGDGSAVDSDQTLAILGSASQGCAIRTAEQSEYVSRSAC
jgi:hypothetical protein